MGKKLEPVQILIISNEGYRQKPYKCTADKLTVGYGTNLEDRGITEDESLYILNNDLKLIRMNMDAHDLTGFMTDSQEAAIMDMAYNLGWSGLMKFEKMIFSIKCADYEQAAKELLDSRYARQVPNRAKRNAALLSGEKVL